MPEQLQCAGERRDWWYAVQVAPRLEKSVASLLACRGYEPFLPLTTPPNPRGNMDVQRSQPLFPGYLFCRIDFRDARAPVITTPGVVRIVGACGQPAPVADSQILGLMTIVRSGVATAPSPPAIGDCVRIMGGPLEGVEGVLCGVKKNRKFVVGVALLQRWISVDVQEAWIARTSEPPGDPVMRLAAEGRLREYVAPVLQN